MLKKNSDKTEDIRLEVLKFMYMSNNGYLLVSVVDISITNNGAIYIITSVGSIILVIGTIIYIVKFIKVICVGFLETYFSFNMFKTWICLPFQFVWPFMGLTDPCCYSNTYTVTYHSDGTVTDDKAFVICFNKTMFCVKRFAFIISTLLYYFFLLVLPFYWILIKLIILLIENIKKAVNLILKIIKVKKIKKIIIIFQKKLLFMVIIL